MQALLVLISDRVPILAFYFHAKADEIKHQARHPLLLLFPLPPPSLFLSTNMRK